IIELFWSVATMVSVPFGLLIRWRPRSLPGVRPRPSRRVTECVDIERIPIRSETRAGILAARIRTDRLRTAPPYRRWGGHSCLPPVASRGRQECPPHRVRQVEALLHAPGHRSFRECVGNSSCATLLPRLTYSHMGILSRPG